MKRRSAGILAALALTRAAAAADFAGPAPAARFLATCEDLARFCSADACGRDQIEAAQGCEASCPGSVILAVIPAACPLPDGPRAVLLRRRG